MPLFGLVDLSLAAMVLCAWQEGRTRGLICLIWGVMVGIDLGIVSLI